MSDKLVFDLAQEIEGSPNVFVRKDWINILDNQNQNYNNNQSILDTSQLSNSNKYMSYREAYLSVPFLLTMGQVDKEVKNQSLGAGTGSAWEVQDPNFALGGDYVCGLKNWFGQIIHSFTLDYNGTTIIQQTPYVNMWNSFKLMTSLSLNDVSTQGATIGFYPDSSTSWAFVAPPASPIVPTGNTGPYIQGFSTSGNGIVNNNDAIQSTMSLDPVAGGNCFSTSNSGLFYRQQLINFDQSSLTGSPNNPPFVVGTTPAAGVSTAPYQLMLVNNSAAAAPTTQQVYFSNTWKSYISNRTTYSTVAADLIGGSQYIQYSIVASIYLKHIHSFFNMCPLLKGVFMKMTMNLNNTTSTITTVTQVTATANANAPTITPIAMFSNAVSNPLGGVNPVMIASGAQNSVQGASVTLPQISLAPWIPINTYLLGSTTAPVATNQANMGVRVTNGSSALTSGTAPATTNNAAADQWIVPPIAPSAASVTTNTFADPYAPGTAATIASPSGGRFLFPRTINTAGTNAGIALVNLQYRVNLSVGSVCLDSILQQKYNKQGTLSKSVYLYIPAYTFNPIFEQSYLSSPIKQIKYTDIYQYQVLGVPSGGNYNNLLTNGIANIKSILILPFFSTGGSSSAVTFQSGVVASGVANTYGIVPTVAGASLGLAQQVNNSNTGFAQGIPVFQSPFDPAGTGSTSPMTTLTNFNVQISGQNAIYNIEKYNFEQFNNQLYGQNAVNGGLTDGITSALIDRQAFDMSYCYYYVNVERMLPVEQSVPKSVQILGQNYSSRILDLYCFIEYGNEISIDALTGARV